MFYTKGFEKMRCSMIWDGMPYTKKLKRMKYSMIWNEMLEWDWMLDDMRRNTLCEKICCSMIWNEMPYVKGLIIYIKGLNALYEGIWFDIL